MSQFFTPTEPRNECLLSRLVRACQPLEKYLSATGSLKGFQPPLPFGERTKIRLIIFFAAKDGEALYSQQKQDQELTVAQTMNSLLPNSDLN